MDKLRWKEVVRKTKFASRKKRLGKRELGALFDNVMTLEKFMRINKSEFEGKARRNERYY